MSPTTMVLLALAIAVVFMVFGTWFGFRLHSQRLVGTLLVISDPVDGDKYMQLEIGKGRAEEIYDGNEITLKVIEIVGTDRSAK